MESNGGKIMTSSGESSRIPMIVVSGHVILSYRFRWIMVRTAQVSLGQTKRVQFIIRRTAGRDE